MDTQSFTPKKLYEDKTGYFFGGISNDEKYLAFNEPRTTMDSDIYLYSNADGQMKHIRAHQGVARYGVGEFDPQSRSLSYTTDEGGDFAYAVRYDLATGKREVVEKHPWDVQSVYFSETGNTGSR